MDQFKLVSKYKPTGDQPEAIDKLVLGLEKGMKAQTLMGVTGSGKTFTMANVIQRLNRPALILAHNKTLAGQLYEEFASLFPENAVEYFVSYYDYYQPEAYIPSRDIYIEKDSAINDEIDRLRHKATSSLLERRDVIVVASVSCIYGLGDPEDYRNLMIALRPGMQISRDKVIEKLISIQYDRNDFDLKRGTFRVRGDVVDIFPASSENRVIRVSFFGDEIEEIRELDNLSGKLVTGRNYVAIFPSSHYATTKEKQKRAIVAILQELKERVAFFREHGKLVEAYRLEQKTKYDVEMLEETGFCKGIENYSRHLTGRQIGQPPYTLMDFFPDDYLLFIDEAHVTVPQVGAMYNGDRSRKDSLVNYGFRLPSAYDNRPLKFPEFEARMGQTIFVSATPAAYELQNSAQVVEQIIRPTGLLDPEITIMPVEGQIEDILTRVHEVNARYERSLILTLTKRMAEELTSFLREAGLRVEYLHSDISTVERLRILQRLRQGKFDVLVGINLLREGIDLPEVSQIMILDADKEGFLRSQTSLIQIIGRAARNVHGHVILYADEITAAMEKAISETNRRRDIQMSYNTEHHIIPQTIVKDIHEIKDTTLLLQDETMEVESDDDFAKNLQSFTRPELLKLAKKLQQAMESAAKALDFEEAAILRDRLILVKGAISLSK